MKILGTGAARQHSVLMTAPRRTPPSHLMSGAMRSHVGKDDQPEERDEEASPVVIDSARK